MCNNNYCFINSIFIYHFNYFKLPKETLKNYDSENKEFVIDGFRYSLPSIGVENCITNYLISKSNEPDAIRYNNYNYDFIYFLKNKRSVSFQEIENLIQIFNEDIEIEDRKKIRKLIKSFQPIQKYSLKKGDKVIEINSKIDLEKIWK